MERIKSKHRWGSVNSREVRQMARRQLGLGSGLLQAPKSLEVATPLVKSSKRTISRFGQQNLVVKSRNRFGSVARTAEMTLSSPTVHPVNGTISKVTINDKLEKLWNMKVKKQNALGMNSFSTQYLKIIKIRRRATLIKIHFLKTAYTALNSLRNSNVRFRIFTSGFKFINRNYHQRGFSDVLTPIPMAKKASIWSNFSDCMNCFKMDGDSVVIVDNQDLLMTKELISNLITQKKGKNLLYKDILMKTVNQKKPPKVLKKKVTKWNSQKKYVIKMKTKKNLKSRLKLERKFKINTKMLPWQDKKEEFSLPPMLKK
ncbi:unnamed protein product [Moneuplotes crassus]|uniref:Uncharacterized protein n=1 Tax=Euplotes crassus TaxID=5936 RepID=A0AAD1U8W1_EUPCR|nr:unnamed protein product [Moneuplotes crassus]